MTGEFRILAGAELVGPDGLDCAADVARQWAEVGCTCKPVGFVAAPAPEAPVRLSVVHDERCPVAQHPTDIIGWAER